MPDQADRAGTKPHCDVCLDLRRARFEGWVESLEASGLQGCLICSMIHAGIEKCGREDRRKGSKSPLIDNTEDNDSQWECFRAEVRIHCKMNYPINTLQVMVGSDPSCIFEQVEFYANAEDHSQFPGILYHGHVAPVLNLEKAMQFIQGRLKRCEEDHTCLPREPPPLPRRILDVGSEENDNVVLYETCGEVAPYITLSHCWGTKPMLQTTKANYDHRKIGIVWSKFPATFKDAIEITRALGIRYLWIDSLCIIQGNTLDWEEQSSLMATIYSNCYLNLAATHASNSKGGIFAKRWIPSIHPDSCQRKCHSTKAYSIFPVQGGTTGEIEPVFVRHSLENAHIDVLVLDAGNRDYNVVECAPLLTHAWAYQERLLSPRTVNFHSSEMTWDCGSTFDCECGQLVDQDNVLQINFSNHQVLRKDWFVGRPAGRRLDDDITSTFNTWLDVVTQFSKLRLTFARDKLPAISGVGQRIADLVQSDYLAGIWQADARGLLWRVDYEPAEDLPTSSLGTRASPYRAPTWSWASIDLVASRPCSVWISFGFVWNAGFLDIDERFRILDWNCNVIGSNPFGCVSDGHISVKGAALTTALHYGAREDDDTEDVYNWHLGVQPDLELYYYDFDIRDEGDSHVSDGETVLLLIVGMRVSAACAILLVPSKRKIGKYERIGIITMEEKHLQHAEEMFLDIV